MGKVLRVDDPMSRAADANRGTVFILKSLREAANAAAIAECDRWEFAIEIEHLLAGASITDLRRLRQAGVIESAIETTLPNTSRRRVEKLSNLSFPPRSCVILANGQTSRVGGKAQNGSRSLDRTASDRESDLPRPHWDHLERTLAIGNRVLKRLRRPAASQVTILNAFEEEGWPRSIYDPLPPAVGSNPKQRLHNTINKLNANLLDSVIRFHGNGDGLCVCWEWIGNIRRSKRKHPSTSPKRLRKPQRGRS